MLTIKHWRNVKEDSLVKPMFCCWDPSALWGSDLILYFLLYVLPLLWFLTTVKAMEYRRQLIIGDIMLHRYCKIYWHQHILFVVSYQCGSSVAPPVLKSLNRPVVSLSCNSWAMKEVTVVYVLYCCISISSPVFSSQAKERLNICSSAF